MPARLGFTTIDGQIYWVGTGRIVALGPRIVRLARLEHDLICNDGVDSLEVAKKNIQSYSFPFRG